MNTSELREKYLKFFEKKGHKIIPPAPLVLENDPTTLFTSSGMQPLVPYLLGESHPGGKRLVDSQPSIRVGDIDEVGDTRHTTLFEMLGNWSLGDYFKKEQLTWVWEFLTEELKIPKEKLYVSIFEGNDSVPKDVESYKIWLSLGIPKDHIFEYGVTKNWWSRSGTPDQMPVGEIGGPDSEVFFEFDSVPHDSKFGEKCHPNCDCGRFLEIGNSVFIQYQKLVNGSLQELPQKNVDFGGGLERLTAAANNKPDIFQIDVFEGLIKSIEVKTGIKYGGDENKDRSFRIIADHMRASNALISQGVLPSNKLQGYILRRLLRRAGVKMRSLKGKLTLGDLSLGFEKNIEGVVDEEVERFSKTLDKGLREAEKIERIDAKRAFDMYQTYGFPLELTEEIFLERGQKIDKEEFKKEFVKHQEASRSASSGMFKGGLADHSVETTKLHTVTHLIHAALRCELGEHVSQKGSNITHERLRFDFSHPQKLNDQEIKRIENLVNGEIVKNLPVSFEIMSLEEAKKAGAMANFSERYGEKVKVYSIGDPSTSSGPPFSREVCGGPHVTNLSEIGGYVNIFKEESAGANVRRIYARIILDTSS